MRQGIRKGILRYRKGMHFLKVWCAMCCDQDHEKIARDAVQKYKDMQRAILELLEDFKNGNLQDKD